MSLSVRSKFNLPLVKDLANKCRGKSLDLLSFSSDSCEK